MKIVPIFLALFLLIATQPVTAFPQILPRGDDEIPWGQWAQGSWDFITGAVTAGAGAVGSAWNAGASLFQSPQISQDQDPSDQLNDLKLSPSPALNPPPLPSPDITLQVIGETDPNDPCYPSSLNNPECDGRPIDRVILTSICENVASNQIQITEAIKSRNLFIERTLTDIDTFNKGNGYPGGPGVRKSQSNSYDVLFFLVPLTDRQVDDITRLDGVYAVEFSQKIVDDNYRESDTDLQENPGTSIKIERRNLEQPDNIERPPIFDPGIVIETQTGVYPDLGFISTPFKKETALAYDYESIAGSRVVIWVMNSGVQRHPDFDIEEYDFALDATKQEVDDLGFGTCYASKIVGLYGVAKKGRLKIMKLGDHVESVADGLGKIIESVKDSNQKMGGGFTVIALDQDWVPLGGKATKLIEDLITVLEVNYQVPIVVKSGDQMNEMKDSKREELNVLTLPALWSADHPLIVVGAVDPTNGKRYPWSRGGSFMTISAPGQVKCTNHFTTNSFRITRGGRYATAQVAGLLAYLLSSARHGDELRKHTMGVPFASKELILKLGYQREGSDDVSIWNGLDSTTSSWKKFWR